MDLIHILEVKPTGLAAELDVEARAWGRDIDNSCVFGSSKEIDVKTFGDIERKDLEEELTCRRIPRGFWCF